MLLKSENNPEMGYFQKSPILVQNYGYQMGYFRFCRGYPINRTSLVFFTQKYADQRENHGFVAFCGIFAKKSATKESSKIKGFRTRVAFLIFGKKICHMDKPSKYAGLRGFVAFVALFNIVIYSVIPVHKNYDKNITEKYNLFFCIFIFV